MTDALVWTFDERSDRIYIHFDVSNHFLSLNTFIRTAECARKIIESLDETFFDGGLQYDLIVLPPEEGTFLSKLGVLVAGAAAVFTFINTDVGGAYIEGLTGRSPSDWAKSFGEDHRALIQGGVEDTTGLGEHNETLGEADEILEEIRIREAEADKHAAQIVAAMTRGLLEREANELEKVGMDIGALPNALDARADFYAACLDDCDVRRVGFTPEDDFPIPRNSFPERARKPARTPKDEDEPAWSVSIETIYVTSPNWDKEDQMSRQWKGRYQSGKDCYFVIEDAEFWQKVKIKSLRPEVLDRLKVQWRFNDIGGRAKNRWVLRVLEFNGQKLAEPLSQEAIRAIIGRHSERELNNGTLI